MGIFYSQKVVVNRTPWELNVRFDGQDITIPPGESVLPELTIGYAKNQNPIMGSADPNNPSMSGARYLLGVKGQDDCTPLTKAELLAHSNAACRMDYKELIEDTLKPGEKIVVKGKKGGTQAKSAFDAGVRVRGSELNPVADTTGV